MRMYQFNLPVHTKRGLSYEDARKRWLAGALDTLGGYTTPTTFSHGVWKTDDGVECRDMVQPVQVVTTPAVCAHLLAEAFRLFPDQDDITVVELGSAVTHHRSVEA